MGDGTVINTIILAVTALVTALTPILLVLINRKQAVALENSEITKKAGIEAATQVTAAAVKVEAVRTDLQIQGANVITRLDTIHTLVNSQLTTALSEFRGALRTIEELKGLLYARDPKDPRLIGLTNPTPLGDPQKMEDQQTKANEGTTIAKLVGTLDGVDSSIHNQPLSLRELTDALSAAEQVAEVARAALVRAATIAKPIA